MRAALALTEDATGLDPESLPDVVETALDGPANGPAYPPSGRYTYDAASGAMLYEEYHPFGTSAYRAVDSTIEVSPKRYRYAAAERDEETGLDHMGLRYYAPWLGRWTSADPIGLGDGVNRYAYVHGNPVSMRDPGGTRSSRSPFSKQGSRVEAIQAQAESIRDLIGALETDIGTVEGIEEEIADLRAELAGVEQRGRVESAILSVADAPEAVADLSGFSKAEQSEIVGRAGDLRIQEQTFSKARQDVARQPTAKERGMALRAEQQEVRMAVIKGSVAGLAGIETAYAARTGLFALETRITAASRTTSAGQTTRGGRATGRAEASSASGDARMFPNQAPQFLKAELAEAQAFGVTPRSGLQAAEDLAGQRIKWAITEGGELVMMPHSPAMGVELSHAVLSGGKPVRAAGEALIQKTESGLVGEFISSHSGHFFKGKSAEGAAALPLGESAFEALGITFSRRMTP